jgi:hypothetical protein
VSAELKVPIAEYSLEPRADIPTDCPSPDVCGADAVCRGMCSDARVAMAETVFIDLESIVSTTEVVA